MKNKEVQNFNFTSTLLFFSSLSIFHNGLFLAMRTYLYSHQKKKKCKINSNKVCNLTLFKHFIDLLFNFLQCTFFSCFENLQEWRAKTSMTTNPACLNTILQHIRRVNMITIHHHRLNISLYTPITQGTMEANRTRQHFFCSIRIIEHHKVPHCG